MHPGCSLQNVYLHVQPIDFRKSIDGLAAIVLNTMRLDPLHDGLFVFINRRGDKLKCLYWHRNGFCLWYKRLECKRFPWPKSATTLCHELSMAQFSWLLDGIHPWSVNFHKSLEYQYIT